LTVTSSLEVHPLAVAVRVYVVVEVGLAVGLATVVLLNVAPGDQESVVGIDPGQPEIGTETVCPPVRIAKPPLIEVLPQKTLYPATFELNAPCVSRLKV
jgi:hypothetical protein